MFRAVPASLLFVGVMLAMCAFSAPTDNLVVEHAVKNLVETDTKIAESVSAPDELVEDELVEVPKPKPSVDNLVVEHEREADELMVRGEEYKEREADELMNAPLAQSHVKAVVSEEAVVAAKELVAPKGVSDPVDSVVPELVGAKAQSAIDIEAPGADLTLKQPEEEVQEAVSLGWWWERRRRRSARRRRSWYDDASDAAGTKLSGVVSKAKNPEQVWNDIKNSNPDTLKREAGILCRAAIKWGFDTSCSKMCAAQAGYYVVGSGMTFSLPAAFLVGTATAVSCHVMCAKMYSQLHTTTGFSKQCVADFICHRMGNVGGIDLATGDDCNQQQADATAISTFYLQSVDTDLCLHVIGAEHPSDYGSKIVFWSGCSGAENRFFKHVETPQGEFILGSNYQGYGRCVLPMDPTNGWHFKQDQGAKLYLWGGGFCDTRVHYSGFRTVEDPADPGTFWLQSVLYGLYVHTSPFSTQYLGHGKGKGSKNKFRYSVGDQ